MSGDNGNGLPYSASNSKEQDRLLLEPFEHLLQVPGKNVRKKLLGAFNQWMQVPKDIVLQIGEIVQMLHNASLLIDDIEDNSLLRRGAPVAHKIFGVPSTINSANYVMFIGLERVIKLGHANAVDVFCQQMLELHRGQGMEIYWRDNLQCPSEDEYRQMTIRKTGGLFNLAVRLMQLFSKCTDDFVHLTSLLGLYFQIRDDYANLCLDEYAENKSFAEDLTEGKFSFPLIHAIKNDPTLGSKILLILRQRTAEVEVKKYCVRLIEKTGSFQYTKQVMTQLDQQIRDEIDKKGGNDDLKALLDELKNWDK